MMTIIGLDALHEKLRDVVSLAQGEQTLEEAAAFTQAAWLRAMPADWDRPRNIRIDVEPLRATVSAPAEPLRFVDFGTRYIRPRRTLARATAQTAGRLVLLMERLKGRILRVWSR